MIICNLSDPKYNYEFEKLTRLFLPFEKIEVKNQNTAEANAVLMENIKGGELSAEVFIFGKHAAFSLSAPQKDKDFKKQTERILSVCLYNCLKEIMGFEPPFGILTGVRPARLFSSTVQKLGLDGARRCFAENYLVNEEKISLCEATFKSEEKIVSLSESRDISLYIGIPFCPTRCSYCSFVSHSVEQAGELIPGYVDKLCEELTFTAKTVKKLGLKLKTVYMGGGTPTTLTAKQLTRIFKTVKTAFDLSEVTEYTVEAGRPDTVTEEKLLAIKAAGVTRISINPQTMNDEVLKNIGRCHTAKQTADAFYLARKCGFDNINTDLIAGLPGDTFSSFSDTLKKVLELCPESITVHSFSVKRAATLTGKGELPSAENVIAAQQMVSYARKTLEKAGYPPYYMYRQSKTVGNLENVGYAKPGFEGYYNVYIMDETHTILACGASAVTKLKEFGGEHIERIFNFKYPYEYIGRFSEQLKRKGRIETFYYEHS